MKRCLILFLICLTTGCASFNSEFDCPAAKGMGCKRLSAINEEYNEKKGLPKDNLSQNTIYAKSDHIDVYLDGYHDENNVYHHPRKVTIKT